MKEIKGRIINYRGGKKTQYNNQMIIEPEGVKLRDDASKLLGKKVIWKNSKTQMIGKITRVHGKKGCVVASFEPSLPGQAIGTEVTIIV